MKRVPRTAACLLVAAFLGAVQPACAEEVPPQRIDDALVGWPLAQFALRDQHGEPFTNEQLVGKWTFVLLGDTRCGAPCTDSLAALARLAQRIAGTAKVPQVLFVSLVPERDTAVVLAAHLDAFDSHFVGASGAPEMLAALLDDLLPAHAPAAAAGQGGRAWAYTGSLFLVGPDGALRGEFLPPFDVPRLTASYLKVRLRG